MATQLSRSEQMIALTKEFAQETDRGAVLLAAAYLDRLLEDLIPTVFKISANDIKALDLFDGPTAPFNTFSAKIQIAFCLGLITKDEYDDINIIKKIRNIFAHQLTGLSLLNDDIAQRCRALKAAKIDGEPLSPRECFNKASIRLMVDLILRIQDKQ